MRARPSVYEELRNQGVSRRGFLKFCGAHWSPQMPVAKIRQGQTLRVLCTVPTVARWRIDGQQEVFEIPTRSGAFGLHVADLATESLETGRSIRVAPYAWPKQEWIITVGPPEES